MSPARRIFFGPVFLGPSLVLLLWAPQAAACTVCFGASDAPIARGLEASVAFLVALTYLLLVGGVVAFLLLRRRAQRLAELQTASQRDARSC
ncbi:MAG: hypothetical protein AAF560_00660 [Acidobacteriota bacterium]